MKQPDDVGPAPSKSDLRAITFFRRLPRIACALCFTALSLADVRRAQADELDDLNDELANAVELANNTGDLASLERLVFHMPAPKGSREYTLLVTPEAAFKVTRDGDRFTVRIKDYTPLVVIDSGNIRRTVEIRVRLVQEEGRRRGILLSANSNCVNNLSFFQKGRSAALDLDTLAEGYHLEWLYPEELVTKIAVKETVATFVRVAAGPAEVTLRITHKESGDQSSASQQIRECGTPPRTRWLSFSSGVSHTGGVFSADGWRQSGGMLLGLSIGAERRFQALGTSDSPWLLFGAMRGGFRFGSLSVYAETNIGISLQNSDRHTLIGVRGTVAGTIPLLPLDAFLSAGVLATDEHGLAGDYLAGLQFHWGRPRARERLTGVESFRPAVTPSEPQSVQLSTADEADAEENDLDTDLTEREAQPPVSTESPLEALLSKESPRVFGDVYVFGHGVPATLYRALEDWGAESSGIRHVELDIDSPAWVALSDDDIIASAALADALRRLTGARTFRSVALGPGSSWAVVSESGIVHSSIDELQHVSPDDNAVGVEIGDALDVWAVVMDHDYKLNGIVSPDSDLPSKSHSALSNFAIGHGNGVAIFENGAVAVDGNAEVEGLLTRIRDAGLRIRGVSFGEARSFVVVAVR